MEKMYDILWLETPNDSRGKKNITDGVCQNIGVVFHEKCIVFAVGDKSHILLNEKKSLYFLRLFILHISYIFLKIMKAWKK